MAVSAYNKVTRGGCVAGDNVKNQIYADFHGLSNYEDAVDFVSQVVKVLIGQERYALMFNNVNGELVLDPKYYPG